jgi:hypothetical protein
MATHLVNSQSSINIYKDISLNSQVLFVLPPLTEFILSEEHLGINCSFHKIKYQETDCYIESKYVSKLPTTPESAPFVCIKNLSNISYVEPNWYSLSESEPYFNSNTKEYCITITAPASKIGNRAELYKNAKTKAIKKLFEYYNKNSTDESILLYSSYYIFAEVKDVYVPFRPLARTKILIAIKQKYFDAIEQIPEQDITNDLLSVEDANYIISIPFNEFESELNKLSSALKLYDFDIFISNSKVGFRFGSEGNEFYDTSDKILNELSLKEKAEKIIVFHDLVINHLKQNSIQVSNQDLLNKTNIEFAINDRCNKIYSIAFNKNGTCKIPYLGLKDFLEKDPINDETVVNFIKNYKTINSLDKCKVSWINFVERFIYPKVLVKEFSLNDLIKNYQKGDYQAFKDFINLFNSINQEDMGNPTKTIKEVYELEAKMATFKASTAFSLARESLLSRTTYVGDNTFNPNGFEQSLKQLYLLNDNSSDSIEDKIEKADKKAEEFILVKVYEFLNKLGLCKLVDITLGCLANNVNDFVDIDLEATFTMGTIKSLNTDELLNKVVPALPKDQQQIFYNALLLNNSYINSRSLLYQLKSTLPAEQYISLNLESASYEDIASVTAQLMSTGT